MLSLVFYWKFPCYSFWQAAAFGTGVAFGAAMLALVYWRSVSKNCILYSYAGFWVTKQLVRLKAAVLQARILFRSCFVDLLLLLNVQLL